MRTPSLIASVALALGFPVPWSAVPAHAETTIVVNTNAPGVASDGRCSLVEAMLAANSDDNALAPDCTAGSGADVIQLPAGAVFTVSSILDDVANPTGPAATPIVTSTITIQGNGARIERAGSTLMRAFAVAPSGDLTLLNLDVKGFFAGGGDGGQLGGGGGLGAGGAVYVREGALTVLNSTFEGNRAEGGIGGRAVNAVDSHGSSFVTTGGGGGGGLGGNGGRGSGGYAVGGAIVDSGGGGGGGGARGNGGQSETFGSGGGGTLTDGSAGHTIDGGQACGGTGGYTDGDSTFDGVDGCDGGGGGGGPVPDLYGTFDSCCEGVPGNGGYGGGGGGGGHSDLQDYAADGARGGFGGGGGAGGKGGTGGGGGFGGGGGGGHSDGGEAGTFGGRGGHDNGSRGSSVITTGGGGAGLGGAVFSDAGTVTIRNSTFTGNSVSHGFAGTDPYGDSMGATNGSDSGGAIFAVDGDLVVSNSTISGNDSTGDSNGIGIYRSSRAGYSASLALTNTIVASSDPLATTCHVFGGVSVSGTNNLFVNNVNCPTTGAVLADPQLAALAVDAPGDTPTMAIDDSSPAYDAGDDDSCEPFDQRGVSRPRSLHCDIGAYEYVKPSADLAVATSPVDPAIAGTDLQYLVQVHNNGPTAAANVSLVDTLPAGTAFVSITGSGGFSCTGTGPVTCTDVLMSEGATALFTLTVHVPATATDGTVLTNSVAVSSTTPDPTPSNNNASVSSSVATRADVSVVKSGPSRPIAGSDATYSITVANAGPSTARNVTLSDSVAAGTTFQSLTAPTGWSCTRPSVGGVGTASCTSAAWAPGSSATFTLVVHLAASAPDESELCNTATVTTSTTDPVSTNNTARTCGSVHAVADLQLTATASTSGKPGKGTATFVVRVTNNGPSDSQNVAMAASSDLFTGPAPSTIATAGATCTVSGQTVSCTWPKIAAGATVQVSISVPWRSSVGAMCLSATAAAGTQDPNAANSTAGICIGKKR